jgi:hypothetical protein
MSATGFTPISLYYTTTASAVPTAGNLVNGELALNINTADGKLFYKDSAGVVQVLATRASASGSFTNLAYTGTLTGGTGVVNLGSGQFYKDASGNIGVGTASPSQKLSVSGRINFAGFSTNVDDYGLWATNAEGTTIASYSTTNICFRTNNTERMRILAGGGLCVNATAFPSGVGNAGSIYTSSLFIPGEGFQCKAGASGGYTNVFNINWTGSAQLWIDSTNVGSIQLVSDYRIKRNIETQTESGIDKVLKLRPVTYQMADYGTMFKASDEIKEGFIAHEVQEVIPSGAEGVKDEENRIQSLRVDAILSVAVKAIQEQQVMIEELKAKVAALEVK